MKKIAAYAETYDSCVQPHNCHGPIATAAAAQIDACITNFHPGNGALPRVHRLRAMNEPLEPQITDGMMLVPEGRGWVSR